jgi:hypothetical protein
MNNRRGFFTVEFHEGDAYMLVHAMMIAATTAMMCGYPGAQERFNEYKREVRGTCPGYGSHLRGGAVG